MTRPAELKDKIIHNNTQSLSDFRHWWIVTLCSLVCLLDGYDVLVAPVSVPVLAADWGLKAAAFTPALTATVLGMALGAVLIAPLGDRLGRRPVITTSFAVIGAASLLTPLASTVLELTLFRLVTGLALGASITNSLALSSEVARPHLRSRITICVYSMSAVGSIIGGFFAPAILETLNWQGLYVVGGVMPLLLVPILHFSLPRQPAAAPAIGTAAAAPAGLFRNLARLLAAPFRGVTLLLWMLYFLCLFTMYVISSWLPTLMHIHGWSLDTSVRALMFFSFGGVVGGFLIGWLVDRKQTAPALSGGFIAAGSALAGLVIAPVDFVTWMALITVIGGGIIGVSYAVAALAAQIYPAELRAGGIGAASAMGRLGATLAPLVGGWLIALGVSAVEIFAGLILPMLAGLIGVYLFSRIYPVSSGYAHGDEFPGATTSDGRNP